MICFDEYQYNRIKKALLKYPTKDRKELLKIMNKAEQTYKLRQAVNNLWGEDDEEDSSPDLFYLHQSDIPKNGLVYYINGETRLVYFVRVGSFGPIKIGQSVNPISRIGSLQTAIPETLILLGCVLYDEFPENNLHKRFQSIHIRGEWFLASCELLDFIRENRLTQEKDNLRS